MRLSVALKKNPGCIISHCTDFWSEQKDKLSLVQHGINFGSETHPPPN